jgi:hypothetical protein
LFSYSYCFLYGATGVWGRKGQAKALGASKDFKAIEREEAQLAGRQQLQRGAMTAAQRLVGNRSNVGGGGGGAWGGGGGGPVEGVDLSSRVDPDAGSSAPSGGTGGTGARGQWAGRVSQAVRPAAAPSSAWAGGNVQRQSAEQLRQAEQLELMRAAQLQQNRIRQQQAQQQRQQQQAPPDALFWEDAAPAPAAAAPAPSRATPAAAYVSSHFFCSTPFCVSVPFLCLLSAPSLAACAAPGRLPHVTGAVVVAFASIAHALFFLPRAPTSRTLALSRTTHEPSPPGFRSDSTEEVSSADFGGKDMTPKMAAWVKERLRSLKGDERFFDLMCYCNTVPSPSEVRNQMRHHLVRFSFVLVYVSLTFRRRAPSRVAVEPLRVRPSVPLAHTSVLPTLSFLLFVLVCHFFYLSFLLFVCHFFYPSRSLTRLADVVATLRTLARSARSLRCHRLCRPLSSLSLSFICLDTGLHAGGFRIRDGVHPAQKCRQRWAEK